MDSLKGVDSKVVIAALGTLAAFGSIVLGAVFFAILAGLGMNEDLAWGLSVLLWIAALAFGIGSIVYFYDSIKRRVEQVTVVRTVVASPPTPESPAVEAESQSSQDKPPLPATPPTSYRSMLLEGDKKSEKPE